MTTTLGPPRVEPAALDAWDVDEDTILDPEQQRRCECPNDHTVERRGLKRLLPPHGDEGEDTCPEVARLWARLDYARDCVDTFALCLLCLDQWIRDPFTQTTILGPVTGPSGPHPWSEAPLRDA
jgi:hypothetical protein